MRDIRGRMKSKKAKTSCAVKSLRDELDLQVTILKNMSEGVGLVRVKDGTIMYVNPKWERMFGYAPGELEGKNVADLHPNLKDKSAKEQADENIDLLRKKGEASFETLTMKKNGAHFWTSVNASTFDHPQFGKIWVCTLEDITEQKIAQDVLKRSHEELERKVEERTSQLLRAEKFAAIGQLASSVAHELRNPLGVMKNVVYYLNMVDLGKNSPEIRENLKIISDEIDNSDKIIGDLLDLVRVKPPMLKAENINDVITGVLKKVQKNPSIKVISQLDKSLPLIEVDALQIQQVFYNIVINAFEAMDKSGGCLKIKSVVENRFLKVLFEDEGMGIPEENFKKIFEPLYSTKAKGSGLGLTISASLVEGHKGRIDVQSKRGEGSVFTVLLPITRG